MASKFIFLPPSGVIGITKSTTYIGSEVSLSLSEWTMAIPVTSVEKDWSTDMNLGVQGL